MSNPSLVTYSTPNIPRNDRAAFVSCRSYFFRHACCNRPVLTLALARILWRIATAAAKASPLSSN